MTDAQKARRQGRKKIALVGNPNVGKSVLFMRLTGRYAVVSNYPGTTVEVTRGVMKLGGDEYDVIDTPGVNSLVPQSEDERVTRDILVLERPDIAVQVADTKNPTRTLLVLSQLAELQIPTILVLNLVDEAWARGMDIREDVLGGLFGIDAVKTVATEGKGIPLLYRLLRSPKIPRPAFRPASLEPLGPPDAAPLPLLVEWSREEDPEKIVAEMGLDATLATRLREHRALGRTVARERMEFVEGLVPRIKVESVPASIRWAERLGRWTREPLTGVPILVAVLAAMYLFVGLLGADLLVDFFEDVLFGRYATPAVSWLFGKIGVPFLTDMFVGRYGLFSMGLTYAFAIVLPVVTTFFLAFGILEDSGYLPRLAILSDRLFRIVGLNGKAVLPMVLGLGCDTMATLTTRILGSRKERLITTILLALGVPCSAQLGVILGLLGGRSPWALPLFTVVILSQILLVGALSGRLLAGRRSDFIFEIPPIRMVQVKNLLLKTVLRMRWFLVEAVPLFLIGTFLLFLLDRAGLLTALVRSLQPVVVGWLDLPPRAAEVFVMGFLRRDYGAAGLFSMAGAGELTGRQIMVSLTVLTLFVPCIANFFVIIKEQGLPRALLIFGFITPYAVAVGAALNSLLARLNVQL